VNRVSLNPLLNIQTPTQTPGTFALNWNALVGRAYQVQFKSDLIETNWTNLGSRVTAANSTMTAIDATMTDPQRFYRVQLFP
jgi:hypothetical protein